MTVINPPLYIQAGTYPAAVDGIALAAWLTHDDVAQKVREGVVYNNETTLAATASTANVSIADGRAVLDNGLGGAYIMTNRGATLVPIPATGASARTDIIGFKVNDAEHGDAGNTSLLFRVAGTTAADPTLPTFFVPLCRVKMPANTSTVAQGYIEDMRVFTAPTGGIVVASSTTRPAVTRNPLGQVIFERDTRRWTGWTGQGWNTVGEYVTPGIIAAYSGLTDPAGWLIADGRSLVRVDYPALFVALGTRYGTVDATHFSIPDLRGRTIFGVTGADTIMDTLGEVGGERDVTLAVDDLPVHAHPINHDHAVFTSGAGSLHHHGYDHGHGSPTSAANVGNHSHDLSHTHGQALGSTYGGAGAHQHYEFVADFTWPGGGAPSNVTRKAYANPGDLSSGSGAHEHSVSVNIGGIGGSTGIQAGTHTHVVTPTPLTGSSTTDESSHTHQTDIPAFTGTSGDAGGATSHNNLPPFMALNWIIHV